MAQYDAFADFYNRNWGGEYHEQLMPILDRLLLNELSSGDSILDIGCGTGTLASQLLKRGFNVTGIDPSGAMLDFARQNAPGATYIQANAREFRLRTHCKASVATFEAVNHILDRDELAESFENIARHTRFAFVFDALNESAYEIFWSGEHTVEADGIPCRLSAFYDSNSRVARCRAEVAGGVTEIQERYHPSAEITDLLRSAGFSTVNSFDGFRDLDMRGDPSLGRVFYQCFR